MSFVPTEIFMDSFSQGPGPTQLPSPPHTDRTYMTPAENDQPPDVYFDWPWPVDPSNASLYLKSAQPNNFEDLVAGFDLLNASQGVEDDEFDPPAAINDKSKMLKRKRQNRAAQRAFRDRKEKAMKDLTENVTANQNKVSELELENKRLAERLQEAQIEIKTLRSVSAPVRPTTITSEDNDSVQASVTGSEISGESPDEIILRIDLRKLVRERDKLRSASSQSTKQIQ